MSAEAIAPSTRIGAAQLRVADLDRAVRFYEQVVGLERIDAGDGPSTGAGASVGIAGSELLRLREVAGAGRPGRAAGLYHVAILVPSRAELGAAIKRVTSARWPVQGASDHGFSEALYLSDVDGNGLEIYADRPREAWPEPTDLEAIRPAPMDVDGVIGASGGADAAPAPRVNPSTTIGHVHLQLGDLAEGKRFYCEGIGFELRQEVAGQAAFVSAGGYHHHVAFNTWAGRGIGPAPEGSTGIDCYEVIVPVESEIERIRRCLAALGPEPSRDAGGGELRATDPAGVDVVLRAEEG